MALSYLKFNLIHNCMSQYKGQEEEEEGSVGRKCDSGCKDCWRKKPEIHGHEQKQLAETSPDGHGSHAAAAVDVDGMRDMNVVK
jgi:hypothetical protein